MEGRSSCLGLCCLLVNDCDSEKYLGYGVTCRPPSVLPPSLCGLTAAVTCTHLQQGPTPHSCLPDRYCRPTVDRSMMGGTATTTTAVAPTAAAAAAAAKATQHSLPCCFSCSRLRHALPLAAVVCAMLVWSAATEYSTVLSQFWAVPKQESELRQNC